MVSPSDNALGEFYGPGSIVANLELVAHFFEKFSEYADWTFLSLKDGLAPRKPAVYERSYAGASMTSSKLCVEQKARSV
jgi:hypothetical protein